jgi:hypothetical protein
MKPITPIAIHDGARRITYSRMVKDGGRVDAAIDRDGVVLTEWEFGAEDLARIWRGGTLRLWVYTKGKPMCAVELETTEPEP